MGNEAAKGNETILLVDDEAMLIEVTRELLEMLGYEVLIARDGREAIEVCREQGGAIDLVILDMVMPAMGGKETFDVLREIRPDIKIILVSGYDSESRPARMLSRNCRAFLQKPFSIEDLSRKIRDVLEWREERASA